MSSWKRFTNPSQDSSELLRHGVAEALVKGQKSSCYAGSLTKCHNVPGVVVTDSGLYLVRYYHLTTAAVG